MCRTTPLWGIGKRLFFLHDGRTSDLLEAIQVHPSSGNGDSVDSGGPRPYPPSEASAVLGRSHALSIADKQAILDFLRSL
jgi:hypothetical protein